MSIDSALLSPVSVLLGACRSGACWRSARFAGLTWTTCTEKSCKRPAQYKHRGRRTPMKVLAIGLLPIIALGGGELTASANELRYNPRPNLILVECDQNAMQICRQQWDYCSDICNSDSDVVHQQTCWTGCVNRYNHCKIAADCRELK